MRARVRNLRLIIGVPVACQLKRPEGLRSSFRTAEFSTAFVEKLSSRHAASTDPGFNACRVISCACIEADNHAVPAVPVAPLGEDSSGPFKLCVVCVATAHTLHEGLDYEILDTLRTATVAYVVKNLMEVLQLLCMGEE